VPPNGIQHTRQDRVQARRFRVQAEPPSAACFGGMPPPSRPPGRAGAASRSKLQQPAAKANSHFRPRSEYRACPEAFDKLRPGSAAQPRSRGDLPRPAPGNYGVMATRHSVLASLHSARPRFTPGPDGGTDGGSVECVHQRVVSRQQFVRGIARTSPIRKSTQGQKKLLFAQRVPPVGCTLCSAAGNGWTHKVEERFRKARVRSHASLAAGWLYACARSGSKNQCPVPL